MSIFEETPTQTQEGSPQPEPKAEGATPPPAVSLPAELQGLVGEGKKYATLEAALSSIAPAQQHIAKLEAENAEYKQKMESSNASGEAYAAMQELLKEMKATPASPQVDEGSLAQLLDRKLSERDAQAVRRSNLDAVEKAVMEKYGDKTKESVESALKAINLSPDALKELAATSPEAAKELLGVNKPAGATPHKATPSPTTERLSAMPTPQADVPTFRSGKATTAEIWKRLEAQVNS